MSNDTNGIQFMPGVHRNAQVQIMEALAQAMQASGVATVGELVGATNATTSPPNTKVDDENDKHHESAPRDVHADVLLCTTCNAAHTPLNQLKVCRCKQAYYCNSECQKKDLTRHKKEHKKFCKQIKNKAKAQAKKLKRESMSPTRSPTMAAAAVMPPQSTPSTPLPKQHPRIELVGLSNEAFNGRRGRRVKYVPGKDRYNVEIDIDAEEGEKTSSTTTTTIMVRPRNIVLLPLDCGPKVLQESIDHTLLASVKKFDALIWKEILSFLQLGQKFLGHELRFLCKLFRDSVPAPTCRFMTVPSERFPDLKSALDVVNTDGSRFQKGPSVEIRLLPGVHIYPSLQGVKIGCSNLILSGYGKEKTIIECSHFYVHLLSTNVVIRDLSVQMMEPPEKYSDYDNTHTGFASVFCRDRVQHWDHHLNQLCHHMYLAGRIKMDHVMKSDVFIGVTTIVDTTADEYVTIHRCDFSEARLRLSMPEHEPRYYATLLNMASALCRPEVTRNLLHAGADVTTSCRGGMTERQNLDPLMNCLLGNMDGRIPVQNRLATLDVLLRHPATDVNKVYHHSATRQDLPALESVLNVCMSPENPSYHQMLSMNRSVTEYYPTAVQLALRLLEHPMIRVNHVSNNCRRNTVFNACYANSPAVLERVLQLGGDVNNVDIDNITPLFYCILQGQGYKECARVLTLSHTHDPNVLNMWNNMNGKAEKENKRLGLSDEQLASHGGVGQTVLTWAVTRSDDETFECICRIPGIDLDKSSNLRVKNTNALFLSKKNYHSAISYATANGQHNKVAILIKHGADTSDLTVALLMATETNHYQIVEQLLDAGVDVNAKNEDNLGVFPLYQSASRGSNRMLELLLDRGANIERTNTVGSTALMIAVQLGHIGAVKLLLRRGANVNHVKKKDLSTPLDMATSFGHPTIAKILIDAGANLDHAEEDGWTPLFISVTRGYARCAQLLIDAGASIDKASTDHRHGGGFSPLAACCMQGNVSMVELLLQNGANGNHETMQGCTPTSIAIWGQASDFMNISMSTFKQNPHINPKVYAQIQHMLCNKGFTRKGRAPLGSKMCLFPTMMSGCADVGQTTPTFIGGENYEGSKEKP